MDNKSSKTILITGGAGFIGSHLSDHFIQAGHQVICLDSFFSGKKENIAHLLGHKNFTLIKHNIIYPLNKKFDKLDELYNLACPASPQQYQFDPVLTLRTSVDGLRHMLDLALRHNAKLLQASTSEVYGDPLEHPQQEGYFGNVDPLGQRSCYDEGKRAAETLAKDYSVQYGLDVRLVRLFNIYGPRMMFNDGRVISNFILQALLGEEITIHGQGQQSRSFMYIDDLIDAFHKLMSADKSLVGLGPFNLGNPDERTILSLAQDIKQAAASNSPITFIDYADIPERQGDPQKRCPDISKMRTTLNWQPRCDFAAGLKKTIDDFKHRLANKTKILICAPAYLPLKGPAEEAVKEITDRLIGYDFDLLSARLDKHLPIYEKIGRVNLYRLGPPGRLAKYLLPLTSFLKARKLNKTNHYEAVWGIMASYGALSGLIFSFFSRIALLVSLYEGQTATPSPLRKKLIKPWQHLIFKRAHHLQVVSALSAEQQSWASNNHAVRPVDLAKGWDYVAKKTKEELQELEILSSRL